jgi:hypothetical protein
MLEAGGFAVRDVDPANFRNALRADLIVLGSFVSEHPEYARTMELFAPHLHEWVQQGGILLQLVQSASTEPVPPFLPEGLTARRDDIGWDLLRARADCSSPLLEGLLSDHPDGRRFHLLGRDRGLASWQTFTSQTGWAVHLWSDSQRPLREAALLEAEYGAGRILLMAVPIDKLIREDGSPSVDPPYPLAAVTFAANLRRYVRAVQTGELPAVQPSVVQELPVRPWTPGSWSFIALPDTQYAVQDHPEVLESQLTWIVGQRDRLDIRFVAHEGDVTHTAARRQWKRARRAFDVLLGRVPFSVTTGNHDYERGSRLRDRHTLFASYFSEKVAKSQETFVELFSAGRPENQAHAFDAHGRKWMVVALEYMPSAEVVAWADRLLSCHRDHDVILVTHAYLDELGRRIDLDDDPTVHAEETSVRRDAHHDGEALWQALIRKHATIRIVLSGHVTADGAGRRTDWVDGRAVHQMMANYQMRRNGGEGWLRILEFLPDGATVQVHTYSPWLDEFMTVSQHQFTLDLTEPRGSVQRSRAQ